MSESDEIPIKELVRVAGEVPNELYYLRSDNAYRIPNGVMNRLKAGIQSVQDAK